MAGQVDRLVGSGTKATGTSMTQPSPIELLEQLRAAKTAPAIARIVALLLNTCGIHGYQQVGYELARMSVTAGLGRN